jgi:hypothetical protein
MQFKVYENKKFISWIMIIVMIVVMMRFVGRKKLNAAFYYSWN